MAQRPVGGAVVYSAATKVKYTITGRLGEGGYAHVFRCTDFFGQRFVMKILKWCSPHHTHTTRHDQRHDTQTHNRTRTATHQRGGGWIGGAHCPRAW